MNAYIAILAGLSIGFLGSFHCLGMCGPLALALPVQQFSGVKKVIAISLYNLGRACTYGLMGVFFGFISSRFALYGFQQVLSISAGILILAALFLNYLPLKSVGFFNTFTSKVKMWLGQLLKGASNIVPAFFIIGLLNGLLPCGLVYVAVTSSLAAGTMLNGFLLMFSFGLGTFPMMAGILFFAKIISQELRFKIKKLVPFFIGTMAVLLILRGLNLGIPYISPYVNDTTETMSSCHTP